MKKLDGKTMDIVADNLGKLKDLFPEAFTEDGTATTAKKSPYIMQIDA